MTVRRIHFESPLTPASLVPLADGRLVSVASARSLLASSATDPIGDPTVRSQIERVGDGDVVLPGAERWHRAVAGARPSDPVWVPALDRNARVVELELARDALANPWRPSYVMVDDGGEFSVLGAASMAWRGGDVEFDVLVPRQVTVPGRQPTTMLDPVRYRLETKWRRRLWEHLTGVVDAMAIERGQVGVSPDVSPDTDDTSASIGLTGRALNAAYVLTDEPISRVIVREDGIFRRDQQDRMDLAEHHAALLRRWRAEVGPPVVQSVVPASDYDTFGGRDDLAARVRGSIGTAIAVGAAAVATAGVAFFFGSQRARDWLDGAEVEQ